MSDQDPFPSRDPRAPGRSNNNPAGTYGQWRLVEDIPEGDVLVWSEGRIVVANFSQGVRDGRTWKSCIDVLGNEVLPWPTHWMPLPPPPEGD